MNLLEKLPSLDGKAPEVEFVSDEDLRKERIAFHRSRVRNGPTKFGTQSSGQFRRAQKRSLARQTKRARKNQIQRHFDNLEQASILRGHLQASGVLPYNSPDFLPSHAATLLSVTWIVRHFADHKLADTQGRVILDRPTVIGALTAALNEYQKLSRLPITPLSPAYVLPVRLAV